jgi:hypothetical protein
MAIGNSSPGPNNLGGVLRGGVNNTPGKFTLSASTYGTPITALGSETLVHDGTLNAGAMQEIYLWAANFSDANAVLQISIVPPEGVPFEASNTVHAPLITQNGLYLVYPGVPCLNSKIYVKASAPDSIIVTGFVLQYYPKDVNDLSSGYMNGSS